ncbi:MAG: glutathione S-transferase family protein [Alphaproteobacteria bacterium]|nr:glutathione S-transferase family protein [Alphaproteobacteria bacterium]
MGRMVDGNWITDERAAAGDGRYRREETRFHDVVSADGATGFKAERGRYHLYVAVNCPWAHRTWIFRLLKRLEEVISMSIVAPRRSDQGWVFDDASERYRDTLLGTASLHQIYALARPDYSGRVTVPVLWDRERATIVNNESAEIIRMLNSAFAAFTADRHDYYPESSRAEIDALNERIYRTVNNGVYRAGFATTQAAYDEAFDALFATLDALEERLARNRYLLGDRLSEADWRLFPTLVRFDVAYHGAFKCNLRRLVDFPNLWRYTRELYQMPGIAETVDLEIYKRGYYSRSALRNPTGVVPKGPEVDLDEPHGRESVGRAAA